MTWSRRDIFVLMLGLLLSQQAWNMLSTGKKRRRAYNSVRALYSLATMPNEDWEEYYKSLDQVMVKEKLETAEDEQLVGMFFPIENSPLILLFMPLFSHYLLYVYYSCLV